MNSFIVINIQIILSLVIINRSNLLLNKTRQIVYFNYFISVFRALLSNK